MSRPDLIDLLSSIYWLFIKNDINPIKQIIVKQADDKWTEENNTNLPIEGNYKDCKKAKKAKKATSDYIFKEQGAPVTVTGVVEKGVYNVEAGGNEGKSYSDCISITGDERKDFKIKYYREEGIFKSRFTEL